MKNIQAFVEMAERSAVQREAAGLGPEAFYFFADSLVLRLKDAATNYDLNSGIQLLCAEDTERVIGRLAGLYASLGDEIGQPDIPGGMKSIGVVNLLTVSHVCWLIQKRELGESFIATAGQPVFTNPATRFWAEYTRALSCLINHEPYSLSLPKISGIEKHWATYLALISDLTCQRDCSESLAAIISSFEKTNRDSRITLVTTTPEPLGRSPVLWDFRLESLRWYASEAYGVQI